VAMVMSRLLYRRRIIEEEVLGEMLRW